MTPKTGVRSENIGSEVSRYRIDWDWASLLVDSIELMGMAKRSY